LGKLVFIDPKRRFSFNPDYAIGFVVKGVIAIKSGYLEIES
jgi:hypothetical protein